MGWNISLIENTVKVSAQAQETLHKLDNGYIFEPDDCGALRGKLEFNSDHMEHMDYLVHEDVRDALVAHGASGRVLFGDLEGDASGSFWGYEFSHGRCVDLKGKLVWEVDQT